MHRPSRAFGHGDGQVDNTPHRADFVGAVDQSRKPRTYTFQLQVRTGPQSLWRMFPLPVKEDSLLLSSMLSSVSLSEVASGGVRVGGNGAGGMRDDGQRGGGKSDRYPDGVGVALTVLLAAFNHTYPTLNITETTLWEPDLKSRSCVLGSILGVVVDETHEWQLAMNSEAVEYATMTLSTIGPGDVIQLDYVKKRTHGTPRMAHSGAQSLVSSLSCSSSARYSHDKTMIAGDEGWDRTGMSTTGYEKSLVIGNVTTTSFVSSADNSGSAPAKSPPRPSYHSSRRMGTETGSAAVLLSVASVTAVSAGVEHCDGDRTRHARCSAGAGSRRRKTTGALADESLSDSTL